MPITRRYVPRFKPGTPLLDRLRRRYVVARQLMTSNDWRDRVSGQNRMDHIYREAEQAGIHYGELYPDN